MLGILARRYREELQAAPPDRPKTPSPALEELAGLAMQRMTVLARIIVRRNGRRDHDAEELLQEAWAARIQKALGPGRPPVQDSRHFFRIVAQAMRQTVRDAARSSTAAKRAGRQTSAKLPADTPSPGPPQELTDTRIDVAEAVGSLDQSARDTIVMRVANGRSREETSKRLQVTEAEVRKQAERAKRELAGRLADYGQ